MSCGHIVRRDAKTLPKMHSSLTSFKSTSRFTNLKKLRHDAALDKGTRTLRPPQRLPESQYKSQNQDRWTVPCYSVATIGQTVLLFYQLQILVFLLPNTRTRLILKVAMFAP